jgi:predicted Rossmann-fold nucleotide-binding protein
MVPALEKIVDSTGAIDSALVAAACAWFRPAFELAQSLHAPSESLAIPTWQYGHEPPTPFATHIAKYFQNSIREDGLLAIARQGIVCMEGKAGTIQEIFQDSAQNYYRLFGEPSPMVLFGVDYWMTGYPIVPVLQKLFGAHFAKYVLLTDSVEAAATFIEQFPK